MNAFFSLLELVGTAAFAASGAMLGLKKNMDVFGVCIMGLIAACGGGLLRDLFLGQLPPTMFREPVYALTAIAVAAVLFLPAVRRPLLLRERGYERAVLAADAVGLGVFTAAGVAAAFRAGYGDSFFFTAFLGVLTGVGGGMLRDVLAGTPPYIFVKHIYACAAIFGALLCTALWKPLGETAASLLCCAGVCVIRMLAAHFRWSLPHASPVETAE